MGDGTGRRYGGQFPFCVTRLVILTVRRVAWMRGVIRAGKGVQGRSIWCGIGPRAEES